MSHVQKNEPDYPILELRACQHSNFKLVNFASSDGLDARHEQQINEII